MTLNQAKHKTILVKILKDIYSHPVVGPILGFKGGTAANLFYDLDRFSVDLDFDLLAEGGEDFIFDVVKGILTKYGSIKSADVKRFSLLFILAYEEKETGHQNVKVEINRRSFGSRYEIKSYLGIPMKVMTREDMFANKLVALYERMGKTNRDMYDAWFFFDKGWRINQGLVERRTNLAFKDFLRVCSELLEKMGNTNMLSGMGELLSESQKAWVRKKLKDELLFQLRLFLKMNS